MKILSLLIEYRDKNKEKQQRLELEDFYLNKKYQFYNRTLITSESENSKGKTTLIRFILYSLGFKVSLTDGMDTYSYKTKLEISYKNKNYLLSREGDTQKIYVENNNGKKSEIVAKSNIPMIIEILNITNTYLIKNILGIFYIDQEKGWTLLNRGRVIGNNSFNIEEFLIAVASDEELEELKDVETFYEEEIKKAKLVQEIKKIKGSAEEKDRLNTKIIDIDKISSELFEKKYEISDLDQEIERLKLLIHAKENLEICIDNMNLVIEHNSEEIIVTKDKIVGIDINSYILTMKLTELEIRKIELKKEIKELEREIMERESEFSSDTINEKVNYYFSEIEKVEINESKINNYINLRKKEIKENNNRIKKGIEKYKQEFWSILNKVLERIEISPEYITEKIIMTDKLKGITGAQLHKLTFAYKIALILYVKEKYQILLPIIIDSPRSGEVSEETAIKMLELCNDFLIEHQIIVSSVYDYKTSFKFEKEFIKNGVIDELEKFMKKQ